MFHLKALKVYHQALMLLRLHAVMVLCDQRSSFKTGQDLTVDEGMPKLMRHHDDGGWSYNTSLS
jgi:hypothetical protein